MQITEIMLNVTKHKSKVTKSILFKSSLTKNSLAKAKMWLFILSMTPLLSNAATTNFEKCLDEQPNEIRECLQKTSKHLTLSSCYAQAEKIKSNYLKENVNGFCFYQISEFPNLKSCVSKAKLFIDSENHDAALFNCYTQFESLMTKKTCENLSKLFRITDKGRYLKSNCSNL